MTASTQKLADTPEGPFWCIDIGAGALSARIVNRGAALTDLRHAGVARPLVLGLADPLTYLTDREFLGAVVGRVANRIAGAHVRLGDRDYPLVPNEGPNMLHGGPGGTWGRIWQLEEASAEAVTLSLVLEDGDMGFPGRLHLEARYSCAGERLSLELTGRAEAPTFCNLASHLYYLRPPGTRLQVPAEHYQAVSEGIPEGDPVPVEGGFDFRTPVPLSDPIDHNLCLARHRAPCREVARLLTPDARLVLSSTEPGLQVYDGRHLDLPGGHAGARYRAGDAVALEPQAWVDAPNRAWADQVRLEPGERYRQETVVEVLPGG
ncbi:galactose mutarotase [Roseivivax sp. GX 12232]|uniref:aldose epimerase family protein n=1 Tax=Roseivivax sp. GX 12232 TaxID=2900547 RepID=UPI001E284784|nr:galactose mutarotase [Roseivivax sp. GX 12232]